MDRAKAARGRRSWRWWATASTTPLPWPGPTSAWRSREGGGDLAAEAGSVVLLGQPLSVLPETIRLARHTVRVIRQNIVLFAFGFNGVAILLAGLKVMGPVAAVIVHQVGSLLVLANAIRILGFERWHRSAVVRRASSLALACRRCQPSAAVEWAWRRRRAIAQGAVVLGLLAYALSGIVAIGPDQVGVLARLGRYRAPLLQPGLHFRLPAPFETVSVVEPGRSRVARVGLPVTAAVAVQPVGWSATHGAARDESALFFTGDENLVELAAVVEYHFDPANLPAILFGVESVDDTVKAAAEGVVREAVGRSALESILVSARQQFELQLALVLEQRLKSTGVRVLVDRVRVVDAHPPREVVPAYRDVSAAVSDRERMLNQARGAAAQLHWSARADAEETRDGAHARSARLVGRMRGESAAFVALVGAHTQAPALAEFRLLADALAAALAGRPKLILDQKAGGRRHLWLADPEKLTPGLSRALGPIPTEARAPEPDD